MCEATVVSRQRNVLSVLGSALRILTNKEWLARGAKAQIGQNVRGMFVRGIALIPLSNIPLTHPSCAPG